MNCTSYALYEEHPEVRLEKYTPDSKTTEASVVILPGGGYTHLAPHEGKGYAEWFVQRGMTAFVCSYRIFPHHYPDPLLDARRAVRFVRSHAAEWDLNPDAVLIMGSSAGGHLAALCANFHDTLAEEAQDPLLSFSPIPNAQILCYPVIHLISKRLGAHIGSAENLLGDRVLELGEALTPAYMVTKDTPPCFLFHTFEDDCVPVTGSLDYVRAMHTLGVPVEMHVFPHGHHGLGLCTEDTPSARHAAQWSDLLETWLKYMHYLP